MKCCRFGGDKKVGMKTVCLFAFLLRVEGGGEIHSAALVTLIQWFVNFSMFRF